MVNDLALATGLIKRAWLKQTGRRFPEVPEDRAELLADACQSSLLLAHAASDLREAIELLLKDDDGSQS